MSILRLMSHNVWGMYAPDVVKRVDNRSQLMEAVYRAYLPDVLGMQEFSADIRNSGLTERMADKWCEIDVTADLQKYGMKNNYTPVFYRPETCKLQSCGYELFDRAFNNSDSKGMTYAVLKQKNGLLFSVICTHYWWKSGAEHDAARVENSKALLRLAQTLPKPLFVIGDLNCTVESEAFATLLAGGMCDIQQVAKESDNGNTHHPYPSYDAERKTFFGAPRPVGDYKKSIDHMFVDGEHADCLKKYGIITDQQALDTSDHCPIYAEYDGTLC